MSIFGIFDKPIINIPKSVYDEILTHAREAYPHECCGVLVGGCMKGKVVFESHRATNQNQERAKDRYLIDPKELNFIDKISRVQGMDILGFYHSHPDHPDKPSETDREWGQVGYSYVIISVKGGTEVSARSWIIEDDKAPFSEEKIKLKE
jgi:proteasome lid subunit RPN8/RPN11